MTVEEKKIITKGEMVDSIYIQFIELASLTTPCLTMDEIEDLQNKTRCLTLSDFYFDTKNQLILSFVRHFVDECDYYTDLNRILHLAMQFVNFLDLKV